MWTDHTFLYHSRLTVPLNLKLISPRECVEEAVEAYEAGDAPLNSVEGFVRQILGWREFVRGIYWRFMPEYADRNGLDADGELPAFYWTGETDMNCVAHAMRGVVDHGYTHHIQRLMVLGNLALNLGTHPYKFHEWHVEMYLDSVDWASLPNTLGMSQHGDRGVVGTKPYCASGNYINKMSNFCGGLPVRLQEELGRGRLPADGLLLGLPRPPRGPVREERAHEVPGGERAAEAGGRGNSPRCGRRRTKSGSIGGSRKPEARAKGVTWLFRGTCKQDPRHPPSLALRAHELRARHRFVITPCAGPNSAHPAKITPATTAVSPATPASLTAPSPTAAQTAGTAATDSACPANALATAISTAPVRTSGEPVGAAPGGRRRGRRASPPPGCCRPPGTPPPA